MADPTDDFDTQVLSDINGRTLVKGASIDSYLVSDTLKATPEKVRESLTRLQSKGLVALESDWSVSLTPAGHEYLAN